MTCIPACLARRRRADVTAGIVPLPGRPRPIASVRQFIELAVNIPEQEPQVGQALSSNSASSPTLIFFALTAPTPSKTEIRSIFFPPWRPASIGPPLTTIAGMFRRSAAMSIPGMILSQLGTSTSASKGCAMTMTSIESAISSRLASEYFMPGWFIARPSQAPMTPNSSGVPPAMRTPALTASTMSRRWVWPGTISFQELAMPTSGAPISSSVRPTAFIRERCGAFSIPFFIRSLRMVTSFRDRWFSSV